MNANSVSRQTYPREGGIDLLLLNRGGGPTGFARGLEMTDETLALVEKSTVEKTRGAPPCAGVGTCWSGVKLESCFRIPARGATFRTMPRPARCPPKSSTAGCALLDAIADNGGVGIVAYNQTDLNAFIDDIEYVIRAVGPDHVGLGTDCFGIERAPAGFMTMEELPDLTTKVVERGHADDGIRKVVSENHLRVFKTVWVSRARRVVGLTALGSGVG
jgi:hypothetical protein